MRKIPREHEERVIGASDAKTRLGQLLDQVEERGASFTITRRGVPVARLGPVESRRSKDPEEILRAFRAFQDAHPLKGITTRELIDAGRRR